MSRFDGCARVPYRAHPTRTIRALAIVTGGGTGSLPYLQVTVNDLFREGGGNKGESAPRVLDCAGWLSRLVEVEKVQPVEKLVKERFDPGLGDVRNDAALRDARVIASPPTLSRAARSVLLHLDDHFEVRLQKLKDHLHRLVRLRRHLVEPDEVLMPGHLLQNFDLAVFAGRSARHTHAPGGGPRLAQLTGWT